MADPRTVLITGAAGGLGRAFAEGFAAAGDRVVVADINLAGAEETATALRAASADALACEVDVTDRDSTVSLAEAAANFGAAASTSSSTTLRSTPGSPGLPSRASPRPNGTS